MHVETYPVTLAPRDEKPSLSSSEEKSSENDWLERKLTRKQEYIWKIEQVLCSLILYMIYLYIDRSPLQWMQGNIYRNVFPTFLTKKSYGWWITRRRMEIYTKISKRKDLKWSRRNWGKFAPCMGCANLEGVVRNFRTSLEQLSSEGHIFLISAPNHTRFKALDSWLHMLLKWYIACRKWTLGSAPKVQKNTTDAVLYFLYFVFPLSVVLSLHTLNDFGKGYGAPKLGSSWI